MTKKLTESDIETWALELLERQGWSYRYGPDLAPDGDSGERAAFEDLFLAGRLKERLRAINPGIPETALSDAFRQLTSVHSPEPLAGNETFHRLLTEGIKVNYQNGGATRGDLAWAIDFENPANNEFLAINQYTVIENNVNKRPDIILFVNGIPLVVVELKNAVDADATMENAYQQLQTYKAAIPSLFISNAILVVSDGHDALAGTVSSDRSRFLAWKTADGKTEASRTTPLLQTLVEGMLKPEILLDLVRHFIVFEKSKKEDPVTKQTFIRTTKKVAGYHQYHAVNKAVASTLRASGFASEAKTRYSEVDADLSEKYGLHTTASQKVGDRKGGVVWHTQGSGKSLSMVFFTGKIVLAMANPTVVVITDRNDLDDQLFDTFTNSTQLLRQMPVQAESREHLKKLLAVGSGGIIFTTIQKFQPDEGNVYDKLTTRENVVVIADEAHRTQYGFAAKIIDAKDDAGNKIGKRIVYGFAKYLRDALPNATYLGFTGTPVESTDANTPAVFGNYVDIYDIAQAVEDGATVRIYYESRLAKVYLSDEGKKLVKELDDELAASDLSETERAKAKWTQLEALIGSKDRLSRIAKDIVTHFETRLEAIEGKAMIVAMSRRIAVDLFDEIKALRPQWIDDDLSKGALKVVMTAASSDGERIAKHHTTKDQRRALADRMRDPKDPLRLVIVRDMWLTGFDAPSMHTLYIDKPMRGHNLMQAIARVNRVFPGKTGGLIVDYLGIASDLKEALSFYSSAGGKGDPAEIQERAVQAMLEKLEVVSAMFHGFPYEDYFSADTGRKLSLILEAEDHILGMENGRKRFIDAVTALSQAFAIAVPHEQAMDAKDEVAFFEAVKARLIKFESRSWSSGVEMETAIRQVIDKALVSHEVVDIYDAAGMKKPDISILSEDFLLEVKNMKHKNLALEVLNKILNDEIKARMRMNIVQGKSFMEMLEASIQRYHQKIISAVEVIDELINLSKHITEAAKEPSELGLTDYEYAFYTAVSNNESARELMGKDQLRELAVVLYQKVKENATIDWNIKENVRAKLKVLIKRLLRQYGYPPDMQALATETVLEQAEKICANIA